MSFANFQNLVQGTVELGARLAIDTLQEGRVIHEDVVDLLLVGVEEMHGFLLATHVHRAPIAGVPSLSILVITRGNDHAAMAQSSQCNGKTIHGFSQTTGLGERRDLTWIPMKNVGIFWGLPAVVFFCLVDSRRVFVQNIVLIDLEFR